MFAGARSVAATLWKAPDEATADLMIAFYTGLRDGEAADEALARAQRRLLESGATSHPFYWAGFVLDGAVR
jgi:CHAT domain-containing protein